MTSCRADPGEFLFYQTEDGRTRLHADVAAECRRRGFPEPGVTPRDLHGVPGVGLVGRARLIFDVAVPGPIILGRNRHFGGGLFSASR